MKEIAVRNLRLCTKDCLCLYVCPVGATDTENSIIDVEKCLGCGVLCQSLPQRRHFHGACRIPASAEEDRGGNRFPPLRWQKEKPGRKRPPFSWRKPRKLTVCTG